MIDGQFLFIGIESYSWDASEFTIAANFAKAHGIGTLFIKGFDGPNNWFIDQNFKAIVASINAVGVQVVPYGYCYGNSEGSSLASEIALLKHYNSLVGSVCADIELEWNGQKAWAVTLANAMRPYSNFYCTMLADPTQQNQQGVVNVLSTVATFLPQVYDNYLESVESEWIDTEWTPVFDLSSEFGPNNVSTFMAQSTTFGMWEYKLAVANPSLLKGSTMTQPWYTFPIVVPFGNPNYDVGLGGSHDLDVQPPPNYPVTAIASGVICDISSPSWGMQVGVKFDTPRYGKQYMAYLHLSAVNPALSIGSHVNFGDSIGWVGGGTQASDYNGTTNPTGSNFLNSPVMSSQIQVGIALMNGPIYGSGAGWVQFPPIDTSLDPTPLLKLAISGSPQPPVPPPVPSGMEQQMLDVWNYLADNSATWDSGIAGVFKQLYPLYNLGCPFNAANSPNGEKSTVDWNDVPVQLREFAYGSVTWNLKTGEARAWNAVGVEFKL